MAKTAGTRYAPAIHTHSIIYTHIQLDRHSGFTSANVALDTTQISHLRAWHQKKKSLHTFILAMLLHPSPKMSRAEIDGAVGLGRLPTMAEAARFHTPRLWWASLCAGRCARERVTLYFAKYLHSSPSALPHRLTQDDIYKGPDCGTKRNRVQVSLLRPVFLYRLSHTRGHGR